MPRAPSAQPCCPVPALGWLIGRRRSISDSTGDGNRGAHGSSTTAIAAAPGKAVSAKTARLEQQHLEDEVASLKARLEEVERDLEMREGAHAEALATKQATIASLEADLARAAVREAELQARLVVKGHSGEDKLREQPEQHRTQAAVDVASAVKAAERSFEARLAQAESQHECVKRELEKQVELLTLAGRKSDEQVVQLSEQLKGEKASFQVQIAKLQAAEKRNEDRILVLLQKQQEAKRQQELNARNVGACGC